MENLKLSIVFATRGDFYGGDNVTKALRFIDIVSKKMRKLKENSFEIVIVDYNAVPNRRLVQFMPSNLPCRVRIVEVQSEQLSGFVTVDIPFIEYHAKNIGIKRARGAQILVVNCDVRISKDLLRACLERPFLDNSFLRADRTDLLLQRRMRVNLTLNTRGGEEGADKNQLHFRDKEFFKGSQKINFEVIHKSFLVSPEGGIPSHYIFGAHGNASGDFVCAPSWAWNKLKGYQENKYVRFMGDSFLICGFFHVGLRQIILPGIGKIIHIDHSRPINHRNNWTQENWEVFKKEFREIASGKKVYKLTDEDWGSFV